MRFLQFRLAEATTQCKTQTFNPTNNLFDLPKILWNGSPRLFLDYTPYLSRKIQTFEIIHKDLNHRRPHIEM